MDDLVQWLRVQYDEDERTARAAARQRGGGNWKAERDAREILEIVGEQPHPGHVDYPYIPVILSPDDDETTVHIAAWDPARVLREIDAKRQILRALHSAEVALRNTEPGKELHELMTGSTTSLRAAVRMLAAVYADRPGYREEWRP